MFRRSFQVVNRAVPRRNMSGHHEAPPAEGLDGFVRKYLPHDNQVIVNFSRFSYLFDGLLQWSAFSFDLICICILLVFLFIFYFFQVAMAMIGFYTSIFLFFKIKSKFAKKVEIAAPVVETHAHTDDKDSVSVDHPLFGNWLEQEGNFERLFTEAA